VRPSGAGGHVALQTCDREAGGLGVERRDKMLGLMCRKQKQQRPG
jgi:hypothetical protein